MPEHMVIVTLEQGSLITKVTIRFEGQEQESVAKSAQEGVENYDMVVEVIKDSDEFSSVLGIQDTTSLTRDEVMTMTVIEGKVEMKKQASEDEETWFSSGKRLVIIIFGGFLIAATLVCGIHKRRTSSKGKNYLEAKRKDTLNQMTLLPTHTHIRKPVTHTHIQVNPLADDL